MSAPTLILGAAVAVAALWGLWRLSQPVGAQPDSGLRLRLFAQVCFRALVALTPFVAIALAVILLVIVPLAGPDGLKGSLGAMITGTVVAVGWIASAAAGEYRQALERDTTRRDTLVALRSEIVTFVEVLDRTSIIDEGYRVLRQIRAGAPGGGEGETGQEYHPYATSESDPVILQAVSNNIPSLRDETVAVIVRFYAQLTDLKAIVLDSRSSEIRDLARERRVNFHAILVRRRLEVLRRGLMAIVAINRDLGYRVPEDIERTGRNPEISHDSESVRFDVNDERAHP